MPKMDDAQILAAAAANMPDTIEGLRRLVSHASVAIPGYPGDPVLSAAEEAVRILKDAGVEDACLLEVPGGYPAVWAHVPAPPGRPTVLMYAHYDVQPAPPEQGWTSDPWTLTEREGRLYGRGAADNKSGAVIHAAALRLFDGDFPVGIKIVLEGEEETLSHLEAFVEAEPERFAADLMIVADMGNLVAGEPVLTTALRGNVHCTVEVRTIETALHSGLFGGPAPDALVALIKLLSTLWDDRGNTAVPGLLSFEWDGAGMPEELYREQSGMLPGVSIVGDGSVAAKLWSKPSVTVTGLDAPATDNAINILLPSAKAHLSMRIAPGQDPDAALEALMEHLRAHTPWGVHAHVEPIEAAPSFVAPTDGPLFRVASDALGRAYGTPVSQVGSGGSIPLLAALHHASPHAEFVLWGAEDVARSRIHGSDESVDPTEIERLIAAEAMLLRDLGEATS